MGIPFEGTYVSVGCCNGKPTEQIGVPLRQTRILVLTMMARRVKGNQTHTIPGLSRPSHVRNARWLLVGEKPTKNPADLPR